MNFMNRMPFLALVFVFAACAPEAIQNAGPTSDNTDATTHQDSAIAESGASDAAPELALAGSPLGRVQPRPRVVFRAKEPAVAALQRQGDEDFPSPVGAVLQRPPVAVVQQPEFRPVPMAEYKRFQPAVADVSYGPPAPLPPPAPSALQPPRYLGVRAAPKLVQVGPTSHYGPARPSQPVLESPIAADQLPSMFIDPNLRSGRPLQVRDKFDGILTPGRAFSGGGLNAGVYPFPVQGIVVRYEQIFSEPSLAQREARRILQSQAAFSPILASKIFRVRDQSGSNFVMLGEVMPLGGEDFGSSKRHPKFVPRKAWEDMLKMLVVLNANGIIHTDAKAANFVRTRDGLGAMAIDLGDLRKVDALIPSEHIGPSTYLPPESKRIGAAPYGGKKDFDAAHERLTDLVKERGGVANANNWLFGHTIYSALTGEQINRYDKAQVYPSSHTIRANLTAQFRAHQSEYAWVNFHMEDIISLLHPDPTKRGSAMRILSNMNQMRQDPAVEDWDAFN